MINCINCFSRSFVLGLLTLAAGWASPLPAAPTLVLENRFTNAAGPFVLGSGASVESLVITNGGWLEDTVGIIGQAAATPGNSVVVTGADSLWENTQALYLGLASAENRLTLSAQARVFGPFTVLGSQISSSNNTLVADGARFYAGAIFIGEAGSWNTVLLQNGGRLVSGGQASVGYRAPSRNNSVQLSGTDTLWFHDGLLSVGSYGAVGNAVLVSQSAVLHTSRGAIGSGNENRMIVTDPGTYWINDYQVMVGAGGMRNSLIVSNGARLQSNGGLISGNSNTVVIAGSNTAWDLGGQYYHLVHGEGGTSNVMGLRDGASLLTWNSYLTGTRNYFEARGPGTRWTNRETIQIGFELDAANQLVILEGARVDADDTSLSGDHGLLLVDGGASLLSNSDALVVGHEYGMGNLLEIRNGGQVRSQRGLLGGFDTPFVSSRNNNNQAVVRGAGSRWQVDGLLEVGVTSFDNEIRVEGGGRLSANQLSLATYGYSGNNRLALTDTNSSCDVPGMLSVGQGGSDNALTVLRGAKLFTGNARLGAQSSRNRALISGLGSTWTNRAELAVGPGGSGQSLTVSHGAKVSTAIAAIGSSAVFFVPTRSNRVDVIGTGSELIASDSVQLGVASPVNTLLIADGGLVRAGSVQVGFTGASYENRLTVNQGQLIVTNLNRTATLSLRRGTLLIEGGEVTVDVLQGQEGLASEVLFNAGDLTLGQTALTSPMPLQIGAGTQSAQLTLRNGQHQFAGGLEVAASSTLRAAGPVTGDLTNRGNMSAGLPIAELRVAGALHLRETGTLVVDVGGRVPGSGYDTVHVSGQAQLGGVLQIVLAPGFVPAVSDTLVILEFPSSSGSFSNAPAGVRLQVEGGLGSFHVSYTPTSVRLSGFQPTGMGGAGVAEDWALRYFGHAPLSDEELYSDSDLDGFNSYQEFLSGTDPTEAESHLQVRSVMIDALGRAVVRFDCGAEINYTIEYSDNLAVWHTVANPQFISSGTGACEWVDPTLAISHPRRSYRVVVW